MSEKITREDFKYAEKEIWKAIGAIKQIKTGEVQDMWPYGKTEMTRQVSISERLDALEKFLGIEYKQESGYKKSEPEINK